MRRLLHRNVSRELGPPLFIGVGSYTFLLMIRSLLQISDLVIRRGVPVLSVLWLIALTLPQILVLTIPMAFLFAVLIAVGRLSGDSEIIAMRSCGVPDTALLRGLAPAAAAVTLLVAVLSLWGYPMANASLEDRESELYSSAALELIHPRTFATLPGPGDSTIFVNSEAPDGSWSGVLLIEHPGVSEERLVVASQGRLRSDSHGVWLDLTHAVTSSIDPRSPAISRLTSNDSQSILLRAAAPPRAAGIQVERDLREQTIGQLLRTASSTGGGSRSRHRLALVEIHKKIAIPVACLVFLLLGVPLGVGNRRGGKGSGFAISIAIILVYYLLMSNGETWAGDGRLSPALAMWLPNLLLGGVGAALLLRRSDERRGLRGLVRRLRLPRRAAPRRTPAEEARPAAAAGFALFPATIDRYVLRTFAAALAGVFVTVLFLYVIVDYSDHSDDIVRRHIPGAVVLSYYRARLLPIAVEILPFCVLLAALIAYSTICLRGEDTAFKACGVPLHRLGASVVLGALLLSGASYLCSEYALPRANRQWHALLDRIKGRTPLPSPAAASGELWIHGGGNRIWSFAAYAPRERRLLSVSLLELDSSFRLVRRTVAQSARWDAAAGWTFENGWTRSFADGRETSFAPFAALRLPGVEDPPKLFLQNREEPDEMRFRALARYVERLRRTGYPVAPFATALASKPARAAQPLVLSLVAMAFGFSIGRRGALTSVGIGLGCGAALIVLTEFFARFGDAGALPPMLAAWAPNLLFVLFAGYRLTAMRT